MEDVQVLGEFELSKTSKISENLKHSVFAKIGDRSQLGKRIQNQETKDSGWSFDENISMKLYFYIPKKLLK